MSYPALQNPCYICGQVTSHWCSRCQKVWYCSEKHLRRDWPRHSAECIPHENAFSTAIVQSPSSPPPPTSNIIGIYLDSYSDKAKMISVRCRPGASRASCPIPDIASYFPESVPTSIVLTQGLSQEPLRFPLQLFYCPVSLARESPTNRAVQHITSGQARKTWCGPVVVLKYSGSRRQNYGEATNHDIATLSAYFISLK